jgi:UDP-N-acetylmuramate dehydrogenase
MAIFAYYKIRYGLNAEVHMEKIAREIAAKITGPVKRSVPLKNYTSIKIGGPADLFIEPQNISELAYVTASLQKAGIPCFILGSGTNLLVHDRGYRGAVIRLGGEFKKYCFTGLQVVAGAAVPLPLLVGEACRRGLSGLEFAAGIPGTTGGALVMNAGAHGSSLGDLLVKAEIFSCSSQEVHTYLPEELELSYRKSSILPGQVVCSVTLQLEKRAMAEITAECEEFLQYRKKRQPLQPSAGSIFKNPPGGIAGRLIENAGLKGCRLGGAMVSDVHANFIVNFRQASSEDVTKLIDMVRTEVAKKFGVELELEVRLLGY